MKKSEASNVGCQVNEIRLLVFVDFNCPYARTEGNCGNLVRVASSLCALQKHMNGALVLMPDLPRSSCARGLADEEAQIQRFFWEQQMHIDSRWVHVFDVEDRSASMTQLRRFTCGRISVHHDAVNDCSWVTESELAVCGRPLSSHGKHVMPKTSSVIVPEALGKHDDLKISDRKRPSKETLAAQKGCGNYTSILLSCLKGIDFKEKPCVLVNVTGYIEDMSMVATPLVTTPRLKLTGFSMFRCCAFHISTDVCPFMSKP